MKDWISVDILLPERSLRVLAITDKDCISVAALCLNDECNTWHTVPAWNIPLAEELGTVTHWMYLPDKPKRQYTRKIK